MSDVSDVYEVDRRIGSTQTQDWKPGDDPTTHPLWDEQVELEKSAGVAGDIEYLRKINKAKERGQIASMASHQSAMVRYGEPVAKRIKKLLQETSKRLKRDLMVPAYSGFIERGIRADIDEASLVLASITLQCAFSGIAGGKDAGSQQSIAARIGQKVEYEARMYAWKLADPKSYNDRQSLFKRYRSTAPHIRRVNIKCFNRDVKAAIGFQKWSVAAKQTLGTTLLNILVNVTGHFDLVDDPWKTYRGGKKESLKFLIPKEGLNNLLANNTAYHEFMECELPPTVMPPQRWEGMREGGYYTDFVPQSLLINVSAAPDHDRQNSIADYDSRSMPDVKNALHSVQETPWRINTRVLGVAQRAWDLNLPIADLPPRRLYMPPRLPKGASEAAIKERIALRSTVYQKNARLVSTRISVDRTLRMAQRLRHHQAIYFPHNIDFRGRIYSLPSDLQPQGRNLARGLLMFAKGVPVETKVAREWLAIHLANCFGKSKLSNAERISWVMHPARKDAWERLDKDPLATCNLWRDAADPWQALAAAFEWIAFQKHVNDPKKEGQKFVSSLPIVVDATCSGLQHLAALTRDEETGKSVNLTGTSEIKGQREKTPEDIYKDVADALTEKLTDLRKAGGRNAQKAKLWLDLCVDEEGQKFPRSLTKLPVMTLPYDATLYSNYAHVRSWVSENHPQFPEGDLKGYKYTALVTWFTRIMRKIVEEKTAKSLELMKWLKECARVVANNTGKPPVSINWKTVSGFVVRHFYCKMKGKDVKTMIDGQSMRLQFQNPTEELNKARQLRGIAPNFIHSQDAAMLMLAINKLRQQGVTSLTCIHDCVGACAADMEKVQTAVRDAFIDTHSHPLLEWFRNDCLDALAMTFAAHIDSPMTREKAEVRANELLPPVPPMGNLNLKDVSVSDYFFT